MIYVCFDIETMGLNPLVDKVIAIGIKTDNEEIVISYSDEARIISEFWNFLRNKDFTLIGFNSYRFDIPFLYVRSLKHGIPIINLKGKQVDLRLLFTNWNYYAKGTLNDYARLIGVEGKYNGFTGGDAAILWNEGNLSELKEYVLQDARITYEVFSKAREVGLI